jgi:hypothetical protein
MDHGLVKRPLFTNDAVGERNPALGAFANCLKPLLALPWNPSNLTSNS